MSLSYEEVAHNASILAGRCAALQDRIYMLEQTLRVIAQIPVLEQDNMIAANMQRIAIGAMK